MNVTQKDPLTLTGSSMKEILDAVRSEPALSWFLAQAVWIAEPALEAFWPRDKIEAVAELLESALGPKDDSARGPADGGTGK
jgi:hypothetical protein